jgi:putative ABC transport system permease protein
VLRRTGADAGMALLVVVLVAAGTALAAGLLRHLDDVQVRSLRAAIDQVGPRARDLVASNNRQLLSGPASDPARPYTGALDAARRLSARHLQGLAGDPQWSVGPPAGQWLPILDGPSRIPVGDGLVLRLGSGWRDRVRVVQGRLPGGAVPANPSPARRGPAPPGTPARVEVALADPVATAMHLQVGDVVLVGGLSSPLRLMLVGTFVGTDPADEFWSTQPELLRGDRRVDSQGNEYMDGIVLADVAALPVLSDELAGAVTVLQLRIPIRPDGALGDPADVVARLRAAKAEPIESLPIASLRFGSTLDDALVAYLDQRRPAVALVLVLLTGVLVVAAIVLALALRLLVDRHRAGLAIAAARGASVGQQTGQLAAEGLLLGLPGALAGWWIAGLVPGRPPAAAVTAVIAGALAPAVTMPLAALPVLRPALRHRRPETRRGLLPARLRGGRPGRTGGRRIRLLAELLVVVLGLAALSALRARGLTASASGASAVADVTGATPDGDPGVDPLVLLGPALAGVAIALVAARLITPALHVATDWAGRSRSAVGFLGLARASRERPVGVLGLAAVLLALATATQAAVTAATVRSGVWDAARLEAGADLRIHGTGFRPEQIASASRLPGVSALAPLTRENGVSFGDDAGGRSATLLAADPAAMERVQRDLGAGGLNPALTQRLAAQVATGGPIPVLASAGLAGPGDRTTLTVQGRAVPVLVVGVLPRLPAAPQDRPWLLAPVEPLRRATNLLLPATDLLATTGHPPSAEQVTAAVRDVVTLVTPSGVAGATSGSPLVAAVRSGLPWVLSLAAGYAAAAVWLTVVVGARSRTRFLAHLRALGLSAGQAAALIGLEVAPAAVLATVAGPLTGVLVGDTVLRAADVRPLTGSVLPPELVTPMGTLGLTVATVLAATALAAGVAVLSGRRVSPAAAARTGELR